MIRRGEIWLVNLDPTIGSEIRKRRPAVVISSDHIGKLPLKIVVPITDWKAQYENYPWMCNLEPTDANGLTKQSGADSFQVRSVDESRLFKKVGRITAEQLEEIIAGVAVCMEYN